MEERKFADEVVTWGGEFWGGLNGDIAGLPGYLDDGEDLDPAYISALQGDGPNELLGQSSMHFDNGFYIMPTTEMDHEHTALLDHEPEIDDGADADEDTEGDEATAI
jgi:hypothetical protein